MKTKQEEKPTIELVCYGCGEPLNGQNSKAVSAERHVFERVPYCIKCQQNTFSLLSRRCGSRTMAMWLCCLFYDIPYDKEVVESTTATRYGVWQTYLVNLRQAKKNRIGDKPTTFMDGISDMNVALGEDMPVVAADSEDYGMTIRERWNQDWGKDCPDATCIELDQTYSMLSAEYKGAINPRLKLAIQDIARFRLKRDEAAQEKDGAEAKKYQDMINAIMSGEAMKAGDAKPLESIRVDSIIDALEKRGAVKDGKIVGREKLVKILQGNVGKYGQSLDVVDTMLMAIINTMRVNGGMSEISELPIEAQINDQHRELLPKATEQEKKTMSELGMVKPMREKRTKK